MAYMGGLFYSLLILMAKEEDKQNFYKRMQEAKRRKQAFLEQQRIRAEFGEIPLPPQIIMKTEAELKTDEAIRIIRERLQKEQQQKQTPLERTIERLSNKLHEPT